MGFIPCVDQQDPFTRKVRATYRANVVRAPRTGIQPLDALAVRKTVVQPRGRLAVMIDGEPVELPKSHQDKVAALSGERSTAVDLGLGIDLTAKFFTALGIPIPSAQASATLWQGAHQIRFEVRDVVQHHVDVSELGLALNGRRIIRNPATDVFFSDEKTRLLVITRTLVSSRFAVHAVNKAGQSVNVQVDALADIFGNAQANVSWFAEGKSAVSFEGKRAATFAFAAVPCAIAADGTFVFGLESSEATFGAGPPPEPEMKPVIDQPGLLTFDSSDEPAGNPP